MRRRLLSLGLCLCLILGMAAPARAAESPEEPPSAEEPAFVEGETSAEPETPSEDETPAGGEIPSEDESPAEDETPAEDEPPAEDETPADAETGDDPEGPSLLADTSGEMDNADRTGKITWTLDTSGVLTVSGAGRIPENPNWSGSKSLIRQVVIESGITEIGRYAFKGCSNLRKAAIPDSVITVGNNAFETCSLLSDLTLGLGTQVIGESAFSGCAALASVRFPDTVTTVGRYAFQQSGLTGAQLSGSLTTMGTGAFYGCGKLRSVSIPAGLTAIPAEAFRKCTILDTLKFAEGSALQSIGNSAFEGTALVSVAVPAGVTSLGARAFYECKSLQELTFPEGLESIGYEAFLDCTRLRKAVLPEGLTSIGYGAFAGCTRLEEAVIPGTVTKVDYEAFRGCTSLETLTLADGGETLTLGNRVFQKCTSLVEVTLPGSLAYIPSSCFDGCTKLKTVTIGSRDFQPSRIDSTAFADCTALTAVDIPASVTSIKEQAFRSCTGLTELTLHDGLLTIGQRAFAGCSMLEAAILPDTVTSVGDWAFQNSGIRRLQLSANLSTLGDFAFAGCTRLTAAVIPGSLQTISANAFSGCAALTDVELEAGVRTIGGSAFYNCTSLRRVTLPDSLKTIGASSFSGCIALESVYLPEDLDALGGSAFYGCRSLTSVYVPQYVNLASWNVFFGCTGLKTVTLAGAETIEQGCFANCTSLETLVLSGKLKTVISGAFDSCRALNNIVFYGMEADWNEIKIGSYNEYFQAQNIRHYLNGEVPGPILAEGVALDKAELLMGVGETAVLIASVRPPETPDTAVTWESSNPEIASVRSGTVTAHAIGAATITVTKGKYTAKCEVTVEAAPDRLWIDYGGQPFEGTITVFEGSALDLSDYTVWAVYGDAAQREVTNYTVSGYYAKEPRAQKVQISYRGASAALNVVVKPRLVSGIRILQGPNTRVYNYSESYAGNVSTSGIRLEKRFNNGDVEEIVRGDSGSVQYSGLDQRKPGTQTITVTYNPKDSNDTFQAFFTVEVMEPAPGSGEPLDTPRIRVQNVTGGRQVSLVAQSRVNIFYTLDGTEPTSSSTRYSGAFLVEQDCVVRAIALLDYRKSDVAVLKISVPKLTVTASTNSDASTGAIPAGSLVTLTASVPGADIYYTTDKTEPNPNPTSNTTTQKYSGAVAVTGDMTLRAIAAKPGCRNSDITEFSYKVSGTVGTTVSVGAAAGGPEDTLSLPLYVLSGSGTVTGFQVTLSYDSALELVSVTPAEGQINILASKNAGSGQARAAQETVTLTCTGANMPSGEMCRVNFRARTGVEQTFSIAVQEAAVQIGGRPAAATKLDGKAVVGKAHSVNTGVSAELTNNAGETVSVEGAKGPVNVSMDLSSGAEESAAPSGKGMVALGVYEKETNRMVSMSLWDVDLSDPNYLLIRTINIPDGVSVGSIRLMVMGGSFQPVMNSKSM